MSKLLVINEIGLAEVLASSHGKQCSTTNSICRAEVGVLYRKIILQKTDKDLMSRK